MKSNGKSRFLVGALVVVICAMWSSISFASLYSLDGYTGTLLLADSATNPLNGTGDAGYYHLDLAGGSYGTPTRVNGLKGTLSLYAANANGTRVLPQTAALYTLNLLDSFYLAYNAGANTLDLGSTLLGVDSTLLSLLLTPTPLGFTTPFDLTTSASFFINTVFTDANGNPYTYDANGNPMIPPVAYGSITTNSFLATYGALNTVDMFIDDTTYSTLNPAAVPEPSTFLLIGAGLAGLGFWRRRKA